MTYTFECGVCHGMYRLDQEQISAGGVKVTCPRCLNYFFLRPGSDSAEVPVIEHIVPDGEREVDIPPPAPGEKTSDQLLSDEDISSPGILSPPPPAPIAAPILAPPAPRFPIPKPPPKADHVRITTGGYPTPSDTGISKADLLDYPPDAPPRSAIDQILIPFSLIVLVVSGLLYMNYRNLINIPGLEKLKQNAQIVPNVNDLPLTTEPSRDPGGAKHGFPVVDPNYNSWDGKDESSATPVPTP